jgi:hypothetical protein
MLFGQAMKKRIPLVIVLCAAVAGCVCIVRWNHERQLEGQVASALGAGKNITIAALVPGDAWPRPDGPVKFESSTQFLQWLMASGRMNVSPSYFSAPGLPSSTDGELRPECNAWCVVEVTGPASETPDLPVLFTRNLKINSLNDPIEGALSDDPPFGKRAVVLFTRKGAARSLRSEEEIIEFFGQFRASNKVLRP